MRRIILDTDLAMGAPGADIDDGFALALAVADPDLAVELVTTVSGNTDVDVATRLTMKLLERLGRPDTPVARGAATSLIQHWTRAPRDREPYYPSGTDPSGREPGHAALKIVELVMAEPGQLTVVAIGPLTNVATALALEPRVAASVDEIVVMGGVYLGHTNIAAMPGEFNFWADAEAAAAVLGSGAPLRLVGLDVTRRVRLTRELAAGLARAGGDFAMLAAACAQDWISHLETTVPGDERGSCALHDPLAVAVVARPDLIEWRSAAVSVETGSPLTRGVCVADLLKTDDPPRPNCQIAVEVDADAFMALFLERIASLP